MTKQNALIRRAIDAIRPNRRPLATGSKFAHHSQDPLAIGSKFAHHSEAPPVPLTSTDAASIDSSSDSSSSSMSSSGSAVVPHWPAANSAVVAYLRRQEERKTKQRECTRAGVVLKNPWGSVGPVMAMAALRGSVGRVWPGRVFRPALPASLSPADRITWRRIKFFEHFEEWKSAQDVAILAPGGFLAGRWRRQRRNQAGTYRLGLRACQTAEEWGQTESD